MTQNAEFVTVGVDYCVKHHGIRNGDMAFCDMAFDIRGRRDDFCDLRPLGYQASHNDSLRAD